MTNYLDTEEKIFIKDSIDGYMYEYCLEDDVNFLEQRRAIYKKLEINGSIK